MTEWVPRTELGKAVMAGQITLEDIFESGKKIKESEIIDKLLPDLKNEIVLIGGTPGKGGGIKRTPTRRTAKMHKSGRRYRISAVVVVGNGNGWFGIGKAYSKEHSTAINKALKAAKLNIVPVKRGCGSWECICGKPHSVPMKITGKTGSVLTVLLPAPKGIGLCINDEGKKIMKLAGITDIWSTSAGDTRTRLNYVMALYLAFKNAAKTKMISDVKVERKLKGDEYIEAIEKEEKSEVEEEQYEKEDEYMTAVESRTEYDKEGDEVSQLKQ